MPSAFSQRAIRHIRCIDEILADLKALPLNDDHKVNLLRDESVKAIEKARAKFAEYVEAQDA
jgi:hypothetical protein